MVGNNFVYTQFQKRRRRSNPSPTSPTFLRTPFEKRDGYIHVSSPADVVSASTANSESPSLDIDVPSPTFDLPSFSPPSPTKDLSNINHNRYGRSSDEYGQYRYQPVADAPRPATSAANMPMPQNLSSPATASSQVPSSPAPSSLRPSFEHLGNGTHPQDWRSRVHDQQGLTLRNFSTSSLATERSTFDDSYSTKNFGPKKNRFHLRNTMGGLLARRKTSQNGRDDEFGLTINTGDVSIRGTRTHDFDAPRQQRVFSHNNASSGENSPLVDARRSIQSHRRSSDLPNLPSSPGQLQSKSPQHSPKFKEHFHEDRPTLRPGQTGYLHSLVTTQSTHSDLSSSPTPAFARRLPLRVADGEAPSISNRNWERRPNNRSKVDPEIFRHEDSTGAAQPSSPPPTPPPKGPPSPELDIPPISELPKHMMSTSSRFSFQIGGQGSSTEERLLEERHKEKQASKKLADIRGEDEPDDDDFGDYDFDDDDDGLEERIPGVNADLVEDEDDFEEPIPGVNIDLAIEEDQPATQVASIRNGLLGGLEYFHFTPQDAVFSPTHTLYGSEPTPRDDRGQKIGIADTKDSPDRFNQSQKLAALQTAQEKDFLSGLGISAAQKPPNHGKEPVPVVDQHNNASFDDDLYFDDGDFDDILGDESGNFDEDIFDDETGKIHDIPAQNAQKFAAAQRAAEDSVHLPAINKLSISDARDKDIQRSHPVDPVDNREVLNTSNSHHISATSGPGAHISLTEGNLAAYHDALASAANEAAAKGRFNRAVSFSQMSEDQSSQSQLDESQQCMASDESRLSHNFDHSGIAEDDGFPFDDDLYDDDLMIAEANAEVLENDDEGFYGDEFGFYARAKGKGASDLTNGGYFGPRGANGVKRSHSAKNNFQEPTLTPITERSEWSTRNSVVSTQFQIPGIPGSAHSLPSPGFPKRMDFEMGSYEEPEMSFRALSKLRERAFGGSSTSISSMGPSSLPGSSPLAYVSHSTLPPTDANFRMGSSVHSLTGSAGIPESEEEDYQMELPTLTQSTPKKKRSDPSPITPSTYATLSPLLGASDKSKVNHSRTSSGAESVSYARDPDGSGRWVLERRRTGDDGEHELIRREYLAGDRI